MSRRTQGATVWICPPGLLALFGGLLAVVLACRPSAGARYTADFTKGAPGWSLPQDTRLSAHVEGGRLVLTLQTPHTVGWALSPFSFQDGQVEVEGTLLAGPTSADYGLIVQAREGRFYRFAISADGYYGIFFYDRGEWETLAGWTAHPAIRKGKTTNHLRIRCVASEMIFWVNGTEIQRIRREASRGHGRVGVSIGTMTPGGARVAFERFIVTEDR